MPQEPQCHQHFVAPNHNLKAEFYANPLAMSKLSIFHFSPFILKEIKGLLWPQHHFWKGLVLPPKAAFPDEAGREDSLPMPGKHQFLHFYLQSPALVSSICVSKSCIFKTHGFLIQKSLLTMNCMAHSYFCLVGFKEHKKKS